MPADDRGSIDSQWHEIASMLDAEREAQPYCYAVEEWGAYLRRHRLAAGLRQTDLADAIGVAESTIVYQETRGQIPKPEVFKRIVEKLGLDVVEALRTIYQLDGQEAPRPPLPAELQRIVHQYAVMSDQDRRDMLQHLRMVSEWADARLATHDAGRTRRTA